MTILAFLAGCNSPDEPGKGADEKEVRQAFADFQKALEAKDGDKVWSLLDADSQADAEREARAVRADHGKAGDAQKKEMEKKLGLPGNELAKLKGSGFLKTRRFVGKYDEVPESKVDKIVIQGDRATLHYIEPDNDKEKFSLVREKGKWKLIVPIPKGAQR
jgi:hypothetical protein